MSEFLIKAIYIFVILIINGSFIKAEESENNINDNSKLNRITANETGDYAIDTQNLIKEGRELIVLNDNYKDIVLVLGNTGSGKTTVTKILLGDNSKLYAVEKDSYITISDNDTRISDATKSKTIFPEMVIDPSFPGTAFYDCPGFNDNRGSNKDIAASFFIKMVADHAERVKFLFTFPYTSIIGDHRGSNFIDFIRHANVFIKDVKKYSNNMLLVITKIENKYNRENQLRNGDEVIKNKIMDYFTGFKNQFIEELDLAKKAADKNTDKHAEVLLKNQGYIDLIDIFLSKNEYGNFSNIAFLRSPENEGKLSDNEDLQANKRIIKTQLDSRPFKTCFSDDFRYTISEKSKNVANSITQKISENWTNIFDEMKAKIKNLIKEKEKNIESKFGFTTKWQNNIEKINNLVNNKENFNCKNFVSYYSCLVDFNPNYVDKTRQEKSIKENCDFFVFLQIVNPVERPTPEKMEIKLINLLNEIKINIGESWTKALEKNWISEFNKMEINALNLKNLANDKNNEYKFLQELQEFLTNYTKFSQIDFTEKFELSCQNIVKIFSHLFELNYKKYLGKIDETEKQCEFLYFLQDKIPSLTEISLNLQNKTQNAFLDVKNIIGDIWKNNIYSFWFKNIQEKTKIVLQILEKNSNEFKYLDEFFIALQNIKIKIPNFNENPKLLTCNNFSQMISNLYSLDNASSFSIEGIQGIENNCKFLQSIDPISNPNSLSLKINRNIIDSLNKINLKIEELKSQCDISKQLFEKLTSENVQNDTELFKEKWIGHQKDINKFSEDIGLNIDINITSTKIKNEMSKLIELILIPYSNCNPIMKIFIYKGFYVKLSKVKIAFEICIQDHTIDILKMFSSNSIILDDNFSAIGSNIQFFVFAENIIGENNTNINLSGENGDSFNTKADNEQMGKPGLNGGAGGNFLGLGKFQNLNRNNFNLKGGNGGNGQEGGYGNNGKSGRTIDIKIAQTLSIPDTDKNYLTTVDGVVYNVNFRCKLTVPTIAYNNFNYVYEVCGSPGLAGTSGADGGAGGLGGKGGKFELIDISKSTYSEYDYSDGINGINGTGGRGGSWGSYGMTYTMEYAQKYILAFPVHLTLLEPDKENCFWCYGSCYRRHNRLCRLRTDEDENIVKSQASNGITGGNFRGIKPQDSALVCNSQGVIPATILEYKEYLRTFLPNIFFGKNVFNYVEELNENSAIKKYFN